MFDKLRTKVKKPKELDTNIVNDMFHSLVPQRKERDNGEERVPAGEEYDPELEEIKEKKRERFDKIKEKYGKLNY